MSVVINEDKTNIENIMKLVGGDSGTGGLIADLASIKSDIKSSTASSKSNLDSLSITTSDDPVVLTFKDAVSSSGEIYDPYDNIDKSLDSGSFVTLVDSLKAFYSNLKTLKSKIEENEAAESNNRSVNRRIGASSKDSAKLAEYNAANGTHLKYENTVDLSSYKANCVSNLSSIQSATFS